MDPHSEHSALRESILEHAILGALGKELWRRGHYDIEILQAEVDASGYDVVIEASGITRHVQLKAKVFGAPKRSFSISERLMHKPSGCLVVIYIDRDTLDSVGYGFFGAVPGAPLPDISDAKLAKHTKANAEGVKASRKQHRQLHERQCEPIADIQGLVDRLIE